MSFVIAERLLIEVSEQMERLNTHIGTAHRSLKQAPEVLHAVRVDIAIHVSFGVVDNLVSVLRAKAVIGKVFIGHQVRPFADMRPDFTLKNILAAIWNDS